MARKRLLWQLYPPYLLITLTALLAVTWYASTALRYFYHEQVAEQLESIANLSAQQITQALDAGDLSDVDKMCKTLGCDGNSRITVILPNGTVVGDSEHDPATMDNHANRPEVIQAVASGKGRNLRFSDTLKKNMMYVAAAIQQQNDITAVIRTSIPVTAINQTLESIYLKIALAAMIITVLAAGVCLIVSRRVSRPIESMKTAAQCFARGELESRILPPNSAELASLAESLNEMAQQLHDRIKAITEQRNELSAVLSSMVEGVLAIDADSRLLSINRAAAKLLHVDLDQCKGHFIYEIIRNQQLQEFVEKALKSNETLEDNIILANDTDRFFQLHGTSIYDINGCRSGAVIVMNDMTHIQHLENMRRDFVANVSHELKTPVTAIKGFVETLREGAIDEPDKAEQFLDILINQADRLNAIIEDLLDLSRIEQGHERQRISFDQESLKTVLQGAIDLSQIQAARKKIALDLDCREDIKIQMHAVLLEQAIVNLIDNAVKYSPQDGKIQVVALQEGSQIVISVEDNGCGIPPEHLDRIFERFYVVDKARSRKLGGTGLGLAIVKHIAQAHGGTVRAESTIEKGSTFYICLPVD